MRILDLRHRLRALGASPDHEARVLRQWVNAQPQDAAGKRRIENFLPLALRNELPAHRRPTWPGLADTAVRASR